MKSVAIIASAKPDLLALCLAALERFAPAVTAIVVTTKGLGAHEHAEAVERGRLLIGDADHVVVMDDDTVVTSPWWYQTLTVRHTVSAAIIGGTKHRASVEQVIMDGILIPHASMLSFTRDSFDRAKSFAAEPGFDTGARVCVDESMRGGRVVVLPFHRLGLGPLYPGLEVGEYYEPGDELRTLWAHLGRGTAFAPQSFLRESVRLVTALVSARSAKIVRRHTLRGAFIERSWEVIDKRERN